MLAKIDMEPGKRMNLLWTICKPTGKYCKVIMYGGSTYNLIYEEMVRKLGLQRLEHSTPYGISWFHDDHWVQIREQFLVNFRIGPYKDEVLCDVIEMSSCHILLGHKFYFDSFEGWRS